MQELADDIVDEFQCVQFFSMCEKRHIELPLAGPASVCGRFLFGRASLEG